MKQGDTLRYAHDVLAVMVEQADDGVWTGRLTEVVAEVATLSHYSAVVNVLRSSGAISQIKRGGGASASVWEIVDADADLSTGTITPSTLNKRGTISDRVGQLERLVNQQMVDHLKDHHAG